VHRHAEFDGEVVTALGQQPQAGGVVLGDDGAQVT
jgi:hypothetical protein